MKKFLSVITTLAVCIGLSSSAFAAAPAKESVTKKQPTTMTKTYTKKHTEKKEMKGTKTGAAAPFKHKKHSKKHRKY